MCRADDLLALSPPKRSFLAHTPDVSGSLPKSPARRPKTGLNQLATTPAPAGFVSDVFQPAHVAQ